MGRAIERLDTGLRCVLDAFALADEPAGDELAVRLLGLDTDEARLRVEQLWLQALLWGAPGQRQIVGEARTLLGPFVAGLGPPVHRLLAQLPVPRLADLVAALGGRHNDQESDLAFVEGVLSDPNQVGRLLGQIDPAARDALDRLATGSPLGRVRDAHRRTTIESAATPLESLLATGLLMPVDDASVVLPAEIGIVLRGGTIHPRQRLHEPPSVVGTVDPQRVDHASAGSAADAIRQTEHLLLALAHHPSKRLRDGGLGVRDLRRIATDEGISEHHTSLLLEVAHAAGLLGHTERWLPTSEFDVWRRLPSEQRWARLVQAWLASTRVAGPLSDTPRAPSDRTVAPLGPRRVRADLPTLRLWLLSRLAEQPSGGTIEPADLRRLDAWHHPANAGPARSEAVDWCLAEAQWLGLTAHGAAASWCAAALTTDPAATATAIARTLPPPVDHVLLQADLTAIAPGPLQPSLAERLADVADTESTGGATVYRFSAASVRRALDRGLSVHEIMTFLEEISRTGVPQPLRYLVSDTSRTHGTLRVGVAETVVRCDDPVQLQTLLADPQAERLALRQLADTVAVSDLPADVVLTRLRELGRAPIAETSDLTGLPAPGSERAPRRQPESTHTRVPSLTQEAVARTLAAVRAGDAATVIEEIHDVPPLPRTSSTAVLERLRQAIQSDQRLWIGYVDESGSTKSRLVEPMAIEGGRLTAFDHWTDRVRQFALHRILGTAVPD